jgi:RES domain-containing protein
MPASYKAAQFTLPPQLERWVESATHPVLSVPSAIVPEERNYLLNPAHPGFSLIAIGRPAAYRIDPRLF